MLVSFRGGLSEKAMALLPPYRLSGSFSLWVPSQEVGPTRGSQVVWSLLRARLSVTLPPLLPEEAGEQVAHSLTWRNPTWCWLSTIGGAAPRGWPVSPSPSPGVFRRCPLVQGDPLPSAGKCWEASAAASGSLSTSARVAGVAPIRQCPCLSWGLVQVWLLWPGDVGWPVRGRLEGSLPPN